MASNLNWTFAGKNRDEVKKALDAALQQKGLPSFADISWDGDVFCVKIDKGGKSEFRLGLKQAGADAGISEVKRDIAFLHKPFVGKVESYVNEIMSMIGATKKT